MDENHIPYITKTAFMVGVGLGWASLMGNPYAILASTVPPERTGVYMGIFSMFIVIPMLIQHLAGWRFAPGYRAGRRLAAGRWALHPVGEEPGRAGSRAGAPLGLAQA